MKHAARAFTMMEMIVSIAITMVLALAIGSVVMLSARVMPRAKANTVARVEEAAARVLEQIAQDVSQAIEVPKISKYSMTIRLPDRDDDGKEEEIAYQWDGSSGSPLVCSINGGDPVVLVKAVHTFTLSPETFTRTTTSEGSATSTGEILLAGYTDSAPTQEPVNSTNWPVLTFPISLSDGVTAYSISRIDLYVSRIGLLIGADHLELRSAWPDGSPSTTTLASVTLPGGILALSAGWQSYTPTYTGSNVLTARLLSLVAIHDSGSSVLRLYRNATAVAGHRAGVSTNSGATWNMGDGSWAYRVYGRAITVPTTNVDTSHVRSVTVELTPVGSAAPLRAVARTPSEPQTP